MKKVILLTTSLIFVSIVLLSFTILRSSGSPGGKTASPIDNQSCTVCHGTATHVDNFITTDIPVEGYTPGQTYNITVEYSSSNKKGFELTAEAGDSKVGVFTAGTGTKLVNINHAVTHTSGVSANNASWSFTWEAPEQGTGEVTFYSALVAGYSNIKLCSTAVSENTASAINKVKNDYKLFPNPAKNIINIETSSNTNKKIKIYSPTGKLCLETEINKSSNIDISKLSKGVYTVIISDEKEVKSMKFVKK